MPTVIMEVMVCWDDKTSLHLKLVKYHAEHKRDGLAIAVKWFYAKTVLMPRQHVLKALDLN